MNNVIFICYEVRFYNFNKVSWVQTSRKAISYSYIKLLHSQVCKPNWALYKYDYFKVSSHEIESECHDIGLDGVMCVGECTLLPLRYGWFEVCSKLIKTPGYQPNL